MAALRGKDCPGLSNIISHEVLETFHVALDLFDNVIESTPSLHMMRDILTEAVAG